ncbi:hypothetical protein BDW59DRAFT_167107, partial [Aspergillus cavernicola]
ARELPADFLRPTAEEIAGLGLFLDQLGLVTRKPPAEQSYAATEPSATPTPPPTQQRYWKPALTTSREDEGDKDLLARSPLFTRPGTELEGSPMPQDGDAHSERSAQDEPEPAGKPMSVIASPTVVTMAMGDVNISKVFFRRGFLNPENKVFGLRNGGGISPPNTAFFVIDHAARPFPSGEVRLGFIDSINALVGPILGPKALKWEYNIYEHPAHNWRVNGMIPPVQEENIWQQWMERNEAVKYGKYLDKE